MTPKTKVFGFFVQRTVCRVCPDTDWGILFAKGMNDKAGNQLGRSNEKKA